MQFPVLKLKKNEERRLLSGHVWVFSNEVDITKSPLTQFTPGQMVNIESCQGKLLGSAYVNPHSLICARLISRNNNVVLNKTLLVERLKKALALRDALFEQPFYRLVYGDSDYLPGLIIDRFNETLVVQITTAGMENVKQEIADALVDVLKPNAILLRNDTASRTLEGLEQTIESLYGNPDQYVEIMENNTRFAIPIYTGQKTGWFYDQRMNRARLSSYVKNKRVLDVFSYIGAWGIQAAQFGASEVICVDSSAQALACLNQNAELNNLQNKIKTLQADAFEVLTKLYEAKEQFDIVILDPPAFIKRRKDIKEGLNAYRRINELAMRLFKKEGIFISASCSMHFQQEDFVGVLRAASNKRQLQLQILEQGHQAPDHPVHPSLPETDYLKAFFTRIVF